MSATSKSVELKGIYYNASDVEKAIRFFFQQQYRTVDISFTLLVKDEYGGYRLYYKEPIEAVEVSK